MALSTQNTIHPHLGADLRPAGPEPRHVPLAVRPDGTIGRLGISPRQHALIAALQLAYALDTHETGSTPEPVLPGEAA